MAKKKIAVEDEEVLVDLSQFEPEEDSPYLSVSDLEAEAEDGKEGDVRVKTKPVPMTSPKWSDYVRSLFTDEETDDEGNPYVTGLRRVGRQLLGEVISSKARVVQAPTYYPDSPFLTPAVVEHEIIVNSNTGVATYSEAASVFYRMEGGIEYGNCDPAFARYPIETASTRAEARAWRKALLLTKVISAEERTLVPLEEPSEGGCLTSSQKTLIEVMCRQQGISVPKFLKMGKVKYDRLEDLPYDVAVRTVKYLHSTRSDPSKIPNEIKL